LGSCVFGQGSGPTTFAFTAASNALAAFADANGPNQDAVSLCDYSANDRLLTAHQGFG
jgi:hypothetical protein